MGFSCVNHPMTVADHVCGRCGHDFCPECVVFPKGPSKPPLCISCALEMGGVSRQHSGRPRLSRREVKKRLKERRQEAEQPAPAVPLPAAEQAVDDQRWWEGTREAEDFPGGWRQQF